MLLVYNVIILTGLMLALGMVVANVACFGGLRPAAPPVFSEAPLVSILVPARNEARNIEACIGSLLAQDYPNFELIVLDDHSDDGTGDIVRRLGLRDEGERRVMTGTALPTGWTGKGWACHQLSLAARGEYLFFTDADTTHALGTVSATVAAAREYRADLVSAWPRLITVTWGEQLIIPMILVLGMVITRTGWCSFCKDIRTSQRGCRRFCARAWARPMASSCSLPAPATTASGDTPRCTIISWRTWHWAAP